MIALYPGTFDPITNGHIDIVQRASRIFEQVILAIYENAPKDPLLDLEQRIALATEAVSIFPNVSVTHFRKDLMVNFAKTQQAQVVIRGLRAVSDFEHELSYAHMNRHLEPNIETVFLMTSVENAFLSSTSIKEIASLGGDISHLVPPCVATYIHHTKL